MSLPGYVRAESLGDAARAAAEHGAEVIAGGTDMVQRLEEGVLAPDRLVDIASLAMLRDLDVGKEGARLGALVRLNEVIAHPAMRTAFPAVVEALEVTASPQVRNLATVGGNPLQKTRCPYFRDRAMPCNRRAPGTGCGAREGRNRHAAILGTSEHCIATHASDLAVALVALDAEIETVGANGGRSFPLADLHRLPGTHPEREYILEPGEMIRSIRLSSSALGRQSHYLKVRDRGEFEWALCSAAVALDVDPTGRIRAARVAAGGVGTKPWRLPFVEAALIDRAAERRTFREAAAYATEGAVARGENAFKLTLLPRTVARALEALRERL
jgi:xanthine dehydrogenase YagS FAD-binding subunit